MKFKIYKNYDEVSYVTAKAIAKQIKTKPNSVLGLATGGSQIGVYKHLERMYAEGEVDFKEATTINLDEYYPIDKADKQSYYYFMKKHLYDKVNLKPGNVYIPDGEATNIKSECEKYDKIISNIKKIDLQILGIGSNGHIGFNEPGDALICGTHLTKLDKSTIETNARFFENIRFVPQHAITVGIDTILKAKKIIVVAVGESKKEALKKLMDHEVTTCVPATMLKLHNNVIVITDEQTFKGEMML